MESRTLPISPRGPDGQQALFSGGCGGRGKPTDPAQGRRHRRCGGGASGGAVLEHLNPSASPI